MRKSINDIDGESTRNKIFMAAAQLFAQRGYNGVSMREISERSKVSKPTIYYYFGSKEGIYKSLVKMGLEYSESEIARVLSSEISAKNKLIEAAKIRFRMSVEFPEFTKFFLAVFSSSEELPFMEEFKNAANKTRQRFIRVIQQGIDSGEFGASANAELASEIIGGVMFHFIRKQLIFDSGKILTDKLAKDIIEILFKGLNE